MMRFNAWLRLVLWLAAVGGCEQDAAKPTAKPAPEGTGLKVVPTGASPAKAPGPKGIMIDMANDEVRVLLVAPKSPAAEAGFGPGDVLLAGDGEDLASEEDLERVLGRTADKKVYFEVRSGPRVLTLPLTTVDPGWLVLSGDTFKGFLLTRIQSGAKPTEPVRQGPAPELRLPTYAGGEVALSALLGRPVAVLFWGTFSEPSYAHLQAFTEMCQQYGPRGLHCLAVDTMELFTVVSKTRAYAAEMAKVRREIYKQGPILIDLFMEAESRFGITELPSLLGIDAQGRIAARHDGPLADPFTEMSEVLKPILPASPIR